MSRRGNIAKAEQILGYLDRLTGEEGGVIEANNVLGSLIGDLQSPGQGIAANE